jgi:hypothetical protein
VLGVSKNTAARALIELERNGRLVVSRVARFGGQPRSALYALTMYVDDASGQPPSNAFEVRPGEQLRSTRKGRASSVSHPTDNAVPPAGLNGTSGGTTQSVEGDTETPQTPLAIERKPPRIARKSRQIWQSRIRQRSSRNHTPRQL